jgi:hypothetical protein
MPVPERPPFEITAAVPGKCGCCNMPYPKGARLRQEFAKWVLIDHPDREQPRAQRPGLRDQFLMGRRNSQSS